MAKTVSIDQLAGEIAQVVKQYTDDVSKAVEKEVSDTAKEIQTDIKRDSPRDTGEYAEGWTRKKQSSQGRVNYTIYNKNKPSIAHLLETGFTRKNGKREPGKPHIRNNYEKQVSKMNKNIDKIIKEGG